MWDSKCERATFKKHISTEASASTEIGVDLLLDSREKKREREAF